MKKMRLTQRYRFAASHRLDTPALSAEENRRLYGKCNNAYGHGHDYVLEVSVEGEVGQDGLVVRREELDALVAERVLARLDHKDLNTDVAEFAVPNTTTVPTTENLATVIRCRLERHWTLKPRLVRVQISETARNTFCWERPSAEGARSR
jgi:6-pyruvoyltetrahydropterin/6-carboxytetrahydropterin synthase